MNEKSTWLIILSIIGSSYLQHIAQKQAAAPEQIARLETKVDAVQSNIAEIRTAATKYATHAELNNLDSRLQSEKALKELVEERLYQAVLANQKAIQLNTHSIQDLRQK